MTCLKNDLREKITIETENKLKLLIVSSFKKNYSFLYKIFVFRVNYRLY